MINDYLPTRFSTKKHVRVELRLPSGLRFLRIEQVGGAPAVQSLTTTDEQIVFWVPEIQTCHFYKIVLCESESAGSNHIGIPPQ
jgi:hypothetical protein